MELIRTKKLTGSRRNKVIVVFDGYPEYSQLKEIGPDIDVVFSRKVSADQRIKELVENCENAKNTIVVSDDKEIKFYVKSSGARAISVEEFIGPAKSRHSKDKETRSLEDDLLKQGLSYSQMHKLNQELKKIWLK